MIEPSYFMIGDGTVNEHKTESINITKEGMAATKAAQWLINSVMDGIRHITDYSPVVKVIAETKHQKNMLSAGYKELYEKGLVRRVKRGHYMINPNALIPLDYEEAKKVWDSIEGPDYVKPTDRL
jgi:predicted transcriptional regulator of viral defense system